MTDIEQKALALVNEVAADDAPWTLDDVKGGVVWKALCRAIEAQAREIERLREALEAVVWCDRFGVMDGLLSNGCEHGFKPASKCPNDHCEDANIERKIRAALAKRGLQISEVQP